MKNAILLIAVALSIMACPLMPDINPNPDFVFHHHPPDTIITQPIVIDTCASYNSISSPAFIQAAIEVDAPLNTTWVVRVGPFEDSIYVGEDTLIDDKILAMLTTWRQQYQWRVDVSPNTRRINIMCKGTNNRSSLFSSGWKEVSARDSRDDQPGWIQLLCYIQGKNFARTHFTFNERGMYYGGAVTLDRALFYNTDFPSAKGVNARNMPVDSIGLNRFWLSYLNHVLCKSHVGARVDWRFNAFPVSDSLHTAFEDAGAVIIE